jgi:hypothetical protein
MHATIRWCSALLFTLALGWQAQADPLPVSSPAGTVKITKGPEQKIPQAPDACGKGWYNRHPCGMIYGPNYCLHPAYLPPNGLLPYPVKAPLPHPGIAPPAPQMPGMPGAAPYNPQGYCPIMTFPTHPYARSPRDFFMLD